MIRLRRVPWRWANTFILQLEQIFPSHLGRETKVGRGKEETSEQASTHGCDDGGVTHRLNYLRVTYNKEKTSRYVKLHAPPSRLSVADMCVQYRSLYRQVQITCVHLGFSPVCTSWYTRTHNCGHNTNSARHSLTVSSGA